MWGECAWKLRGGKRCGQPAVGHRDLDGQYPRALRRQAVCEQHKRAVDHRPSPVAHPDAKRERVIGSMRMVVSGGWRVEPIVVERGGRTLKLYRVTQHGVLVCECRSPAEMLAAVEGIDARGRLSG
jgi:hypothetical protein